MDDEQAILQHGVARYLAEECGFDDPDDSAIQGLLTNAPVDALSSFAAAVAARHLGLSRDDALALVAHDAARSGDVAQRVEATYRSHVAQDPVVDPDEPLGLRLYVAGLLPEGIAQIVDEVQ